jgi:hypothetical protein
VITPEELRRRHRKVHRQALLALAGGVLLLPVLVPVWTVELAWHLVKLPGWIWRVRRRVREHSSGRPAGGA